MKGALAKEAIFGKILEMFEGSFVYNNGKEVRIPYDEGNGPIQIKVALTCAKDLVDPANGELFEANERAAADIEEAFVKNFPEPRKPVEPTETEKQNVEDLIKALGL